MSRKFSLLNLLFITLLLFAPKAFSQDQDFYIFLCFGQSNMEGQGTIEDQDKTVDARFQVMEAVNCSNLGRSMGKWYTAKPPLCRCYSGLSPADYFGRTLVDSLPSNIKIGVINVSVAGCKIELFDKDNYQTYAASMESWMKNIINEYGGNPYGRLVEIAKLAQKDEVIKGILLHQGESNTGDNQWPSKVKKNYNNLMTDLELDPTKVPLLAGEVVNADQGGICASVNSIIAKLPQILPNSYVISSKGCTDAPDNLHFNSAGYRELGKRYAIQMISLLKNQTTGVHENKSNIIDNYQLKQNYPNPFNPTTVISYQLPNAEYVSLKIYDVLGNEVATLVDEYQQPGSYQFTFNGQSNSQIRNYAKLSSGIYLYRLQAGEHSITKKMLMMK